MSLKQEKLLNQLINLHPKYIDLSLDRLKILLDKIGNPHLKLPPVIHLAGTNGKGSTLNFIRNILQINNYSVHCYTSPHLKKFEERFVVSNKQITQKKLLEILYYIKKINQNNKITFFEITTAAAFYIFSKERADFVLLETGLGGRLDATNIITKSLIDIITPISYDHQEFLGRQLSNIVREKLGIIKKNSIIIVGNQNNIVKKIIKTKLKKLKNKKLFFNQNYILKKINKKEFILKINNENLIFFKPSLEGLHQVENACTAICAVFELKKLNYKIKLESINKGLSSTIWPGRLEKGFIKKIPVYLDGAHNVAGAKILYNFFKPQLKKRWLIFGMLNNKDIKKYLTIFKDFIDGVIAIEIPNEKNTFTTKQIANVCKSINLECIEKKNINKANQYLLNIIKPEEIIISGSLYLIGKIRKLYVQ